MVNFGHATWDVLLELAPWLLFGTLLAALLHVLLPKNLIRRQLSGYGGTLKAVVLGVPLPLCSCGVIPAGIGLKRTGASNGAAMGFLISTPQTGVDSILVSATFLGWPFALFKVAAAAITGVAGGWWVEGMKDEVPAEEADAADDAAEDEDGAGNPILRKISDMTAHGAELLQSIWRWLAVGVLGLRRHRDAPAAAGMARPRRPGERSAPPRPRSSCPLPLYVCATASVPIAAALVSNGLPWAPPSSS